MPDAVLIMTVMRERQRGDGAIMKKAAVKNRNDCAEMPCKMASKYNIPPLFCPQNKRIANAKKKRFANIGNIMRMR